MGWKAGGLYINPKKLGGTVKPCMVETVSFLNCLALNKQNDDKCMRQKELLVTCTQAQTVSFLNCLALNKQNDDKCMRQKELLVTCTQAQKGKPKNAARTINYHLQRLGRDKFN